MTAPQDWWGEEEKATGARLGALVKELSGLSSTVVLRIGSGPDIDVYVIGKDPASPGAFLGVRTRVTET